VVGNVPSVARKTDECLVVVMATKARWWSQPKWWPRGEKRKKTGQIWFFLNFGFCFLLSQAMESKSIYREWKRDVWFPLVPNLSPWIDPEGSQLLIQSRHHGLSDLLQRRGCYCCRCWKRKKLKWWRLSVCWSWCCNGRPVQVEKYKDFSKWWKTQMIFQSGEKYKDFFLT